MLEGFEDITYPLTESEKQLVPTFVRCLNKKHGKENAVTSMEIIKALPELTGARVRKIINYIRNAYLVPGLMASSAGYYISRDPAEIEEYINSLGHREQAIGTIRRKMEEYLQQLKNDERKRHIERTGVSV